MSAKAYLQGALKPLNDIDSYLIFSILCVYLSKAMLHLFFYICTLWKLTGVQYFCSIGDTVAGFSVNIRHVSYVLNGNDMTLTCSSD